MKDFSTEKRKIQFTIDGDVFDIVSDIPGVTAFEFADLTDKLESDQSAGFDEDIEAMNRLMDMILTDESCELFMSRLKDKNRPITAAQFFQVIDYAMEELGLRPTGPSEESSDGSESPESGTPSTESALSTESTPDS